jgi:hypothetical protein
MYDIYLLTLLMSVDKVEDFKLLWLVLTLPLGWLFLLIGSVKKDSREATERIWERFREVEASIRTAELKINSVEQKYVTDIQVREIIREAFVPIRDEYAETKMMIQAVAITLKTLEIEIVKLTSQIKD